MDIFWRKETELRGEADDGRRKERGGNSDNARFHISLEKMNEPSPVSSLTRTAAGGVLLATLFNLKMGGVLVKLCPWVKWVSYN